MYERDKQNVKIMFPMISAVSEVLQIKELPGLKLRGVMAIPAPQSDYELQRIPYRKLFQAVAQLNDPELDTFSFGMTGDLRAAITEGATMLRIGTALFGARDYPQPS